MCTAATYKTKDFYFGRTLDLDFSYGDEIAITPRNYVLNFKDVDSIKEHYAIIGMACDKVDYPLYYDAINEAGLCIAALNFSGNAYYRDYIDGKDNIASFEVIPWILSQCSTVKEVINLLENVNIINVEFNDQLPIAELHWIISDSNDCITLESVREGINIYNNPVGILTNNPPFDYQMTYLNNYMALSPAAPKNKFCSRLNLKTYSHGMGALGLPGDLSSCSRFVRVAYVKENSISSDDEESSVSQFFHILNSVEQQRGCCELGDDKYDITLYTSCCNANRGVYYYTSYDNHQITAIDMYKEDLNGSSIIRYSLIDREQIRFQN